MALKTAKIKNKKKHESGSHSTIINCLIVSLLLHIFVCLGPVKLPSQFYTKKLQSFSVKLLSSTTEINAAQETLKPSLQLKQSLEEDTISLNTKDKRYFSYAQKIKELLMKNWEYPDEALENLIEGECVVLFSLNNMGSLINATITSSSSYMILDEEAIRAIKFAAPFPPFPDSIKVSKLNIKAELIYEIASR